MCHFFVASHWHDRCNIKGAPGDRGAKGGRLSFSTRLAQSQAHLFGITSAATAMAEDYGKLSREPLARANDICERAIFWGLVNRVFVVVIAMIRGVLTFG